MTKLATLRVFSIIALTFASAPALATAQAPTPAEAAQTQVTYAPDESAVGLDLPRARHRRARALRIAGWTMLAVSVAGVVGSTVAGGILDINDVDEPDNCAIFALGSTLATLPVVVTGSVLTARGYGIERRERNRVRVSAQGAGLRLSF